jgi:hypothetical protein
MPIPNLMEILERMRTDYEKTIRKIASQHGIALLNISNNQEQIGMELNAQDLEKFKRGEEAVPLRISGVLYYLNKGLFEDAAYQLSRAGRSALYGPDRILFGKIRYLGEIMFMQIADAKSLHGQKYYRYMENVCFGFLEAAEGYLKGGNERAGLRAFRRFERVGRKRSFNHPKMDMPLRRIMEYYPDLTERIERYRTDVKA